MTVSMIYLLVFWYFVEVVSPVGKYFVEVVSPVDK
jgi:hypothetical protein